MARNRIMRVRLNEVEEKRVKEIADRMGCTFSEAVREIFKNTELREVKTLTAVSVIGAEKGNSGAMVSQAERAAVVA